MKKETWITILIIIFIIALSYYAISKNGINSNDEFVKCISENAALYTQTGCFACRKQEDLFGESYKDLNVINCGEQENYQECFVKNNIMYTPTWIINYEKYIGYKTLDELSELTNCELKKEENIDG